MMTQDQVNLLTAAKEKAIERGDKNKALKFESALSALGEQKPVFDSRPSVSENLQLPPDQRLLAGEVDERVLGQEPGFIETELGQSAGGLVGGFKGFERGVRLSQGIPHPLAKGAVIGASSALGAAVGGATGELGQQGVQLATESDLEPDNIRQSVNRALRAGGEEAVYDLLGNALFKSGEIAFRAFRPKADEVGKSIDALLKEGGSHASIAQATNNTLWSGLEGLSRGAIIGSNDFAKLNLAQDEAVELFSKNYIENYTDQALDNLKDVPIGRLILGVREAGSSAHSDASSLLFSKLDELAGDIPVDVSAVSEVAQKKLGRLSASGNIGKTAEGGEVLEKLAVLGSDSNGRLTFEAANDARSDLLARIRGLSQSKSDAPIAKNLSDAVKVLDQAMEESAKELSPEALKAWRKANKFWRFGKEKFNNDLVSSLLKRDDSPSKIAGAAFRSGNVEEVFALRRMIKAASVTDKSIDFNKTWRQVQGNYLDKFLPESADELAKSEILKLHSSRRHKKTLRALFPKAQQERILDISRTLDSMIKRRQGRGFLNLAQLAQGGGAVALLSTPEASDAAPLLFMFAGPKMLASISSSPALTKAFVSWAKSKPTTTARLTAATKFARLTGLSIEDLMSQQEIEESSQKGAERLGQLKLGGR